MVLMSNCCRHQAHERAEQKGTPSVWWVSNTSLTTAKTPETKETKTYTDLSKGTIPREVP